MCVRETKLNRMYGQFGSDTNGKVYKNRFWLTAERLGANLTSAEVNTAFEFFDNQKKGFFTFQDFVRVSKMVQGYEIDQIISQGIFKRGSRAPGKRCNGFIDVAHIEYDKQKLFKEKAQAQSMNKKFKPTTF